MNPTKPMDDTAVMRSLQRDLTLIRSLEQTGTLMRWTMAALAQLGDVFTDAPECAAQVAMAENLKALATRMAGSMTLPDVIDHGMLLLNGNEFSKVGVRLDGSLVVPPDLLRDSAAFPRDVYFRGVWTLRLEGLSGPSLRLAFFPVHDDRDNAWVVDEAQAFYAWLFNRPSLPSLAARPV